MLWAVIDKYVWLYKFIVQLVESLPLNYIYGFHVAGLEVTDAFCSDEHVSSVMRNAVRETKALFPDLLNMFYTCYFTVYLAPCYHINVTPRIKHVGRQEKHLDLKT
jgi:hypothetical protein